MYDEARLEAAQNVQFILVPFFCIGTLLIFGRNADQIIDHAAIVAALCVVPAALEGELLLLQMSHGMARNLLIAQVPPRDRRIEERGAPIRSVVALVTLPQVAEGGVMPKSEQG